MLKKLRQLLADTRAKAEAINKLAISENRVLTDAEQVEFDALIAEGEKIKKQIVSQEALAEIERSAPAVAQIEVGADHATEKPWQSMAEQLMAVRTFAKSKGTRVDPRLHAAALGGNESVDSEGGFLVAPEFAPGVWQRTYEASQLASRCFDQPMTTSNRLVVPAVDECDVDRHLAEKTAGGKPNRFAPAVIPRRVRWKAVRSIPSILWMRGMRLSCWP